MNSKFEARLERLVYKIEHSQTPVPGFIVGLSGTDSIVAFLLLYSAMSIVGIDQYRLYGIHYVSEDRHKPSTFQREAIPWLKEKCSAARIEVQTPLGGNQDPQRWADIHTRALHTIDWMSDEECRFFRREHGDTFWIVGCMNATEKALGKYSLISTSVAIQPIQTLYKTDIMAICEEFEVPQKIIENARLPDCLCGRDELAAENIELIDKILRYHDTSSYDPDLVRKITEWIRDLKNSYDFKQRIPYII